MTEQRGPWDITEGGDGRRPNDQQPSGTVDPQPPAGGTTGSPDEVEAAVDRMWKPVLAPLLLVALAGLVLVVCGGFFNLGLGGLGYLLMVLAIPAAVLAITTGARRAYPGDDTGRARVLGAVFLAVFFVSLVGILAPVAGQLVRWFDPEDYAARYGSRVEVSLPSSCTNRVTYHGGGGKREDPAVSCEDASWSIDGQPRSATVVIDLYKDVSGDRIPDSVDAYVLDDEGYSVGRVGSVSTAGLWGGVPLWWLPIGLVGALTALNALEKVGWLGRLPEPGPADPLRTEA